MRVFMSYRRADTQTAARAIKEFLDATPRVKEVFLDFDTIPAGEDFIEAIHGALRRSDAALVLIGQDWMAIQPDGTRRIDNPQDFVRREVAEALAAHKKVIPVLIDAAVMPSESQLPDDLKPLSRLNAFTFRTSHFKADMASLLNVAADTPGKGLSYWRRPALTVSGGLMRVVAGALIASALMFGGLVWFDAAATSQGACGSLNCLLAEHIGGYSKSAVAEMPARILQRDFGGLTAAVLAAWIALGAAMPFLWRALRR
jgi:hypothetical protein